MTKQKTKLKENKNEKTISKKLYQVKVNSGSGNISTYLIEATNKEEAEKNYPKGKLVNIKNTKVETAFKTIEEVIVTPKRDEKKQARMVVARSFEVNKPGTPPEELVGGVLAGSIIQGVLED